MTTDEHRTGAPSASEDVITPVHVSMTRVVAVGMLCWLVALLVVMVVPAFHTGDTAWWPWCCIAGFGLGGIGLFYLKRGRGNAADA